jgi:signal transduction histidine kinase
MLDLVQKTEPACLQEKAEKNILIVDDEAIIRDLCIRALKGYRVLEARNGEDALAVFAQGGVDVILTDVMMPGMDGIELLRRLKELEPTIVVIVMTGFAEKDVILNALKADADDFISKPVNLLQLKTAVDKALVKKSLKEEIASLKSIDRFKTSFLSIISHKFRTPLTSISLFMQNLSNGVFSVEDAAFKMNLGLVSDEAAYLERLVADLLVFSRMMNTGEALKLKPCSLHKVIHGILAESREIATRPGVEAVLDLQPVPPVAADREKLGFAIRQIVDNAYKFSGEEGQVTIALRQEADRLLLEVKDHGCGIPHDDLPKVFEKFYQVDPHNTGQVRGFGLGLYYAREFVRMHAGSITIASEPARGTAVTVSLPVQQGALPVATDSVGE